MIDPPFQTGRTARPTHLTPRERLFDQHLNIRSVALTGLFVIAVFYPLHLGRMIFLPMTLAVVFTVLLAPLLRAMKRFKIPEPIGAALLLSAVIAICGYGVARLAEPTADWAARLPEAFLEAEY